MPRKMASVKKAKPSSANSGPICGTGPFHKFRPQETEFERKYRARYGADSEQDGRSLRPTLRQIEGFPVSLHQPAPFGGCKEYGHRDAERGEDDVKA